MCGGNWDFKFSMKLKRKKKKRKKRKESNWAMTNILSISVHYGINIKSHSPFHL